MAWDPCPNCGGKVYAGYAQYLSTLDDLNKENSDIPSGVEHGTEIAESAPTGGVGICSVCATAVGARGSEDAALTEPNAADQIPAESPEHLPVPTGVTATPVHEVDPDAVPA